MSAKISLTLYEEMLLLALDDRKGTTGMSAWHTTAMGGVILAELVLMGKLHIGTDKKKMVDAEPGAQVDDPLLSECLRLVQDAKRRKRGSEWVAKFAGLKDLRNRAARGLVSKGVLNESNDKVLGIFPRTIFPTRDGGPEQALVARLTDAVMGDSDRIDPRTMVVVAVANATALLEKAIPKKDLKGRKARLKQLSEGQLAAGATGEALQAVQAAQAAVAAALIATTVATSAATS